MKLKPVVINDYNQYMLGVDKLDQFASYYSFLHKSVKWWKMIFWMLKVAVINSQEVTRTVTNDTQSVPSSTD